MKRTKQERLRLSILVGCMVVFVALAAGRLVQLQIVKASEYGEIVDRQSSKKIPIPANRGMIYDRYGRVVARNVDCFVLFAWPTSQRQVDEVCKFVERHYGLRRGTARKQYDIGVRSFSYIDRNVSDETALALDGRLPNGLYLRQETRREYPFGAVGKQVVGFTNIDNVGQSGFEFSYNKQLAGKKGYADVQRDGGGEIFRVRESALVKPVPGRSVVLTIDWRLQEIVEQELATAIDEFNAESGCAVFMDCRNGDILAIAHSDPKEKDPERPLKCRAVTDMFEPGSVVKAFTAAGILDAGLVDFDDTTFCEKGKWKVDRRILHDDKELEWLTFREIMELSSNIGLGKYALDLGGDALTATYRRFGLGQKLNFGLPGEASGMIAQPRWSDYNIAALAMGHSITVTPVQLATGFAAIANGGDLIRPRVVLGDVDGSGYVEPAEEAEVLGRVMSRSNVDSLHSFLRGVVTHGTAEKVNSPVVAIAGKTGTAQIPRPGGGYYWSRYMASFAGFFPFEEPQIAAMVVLEAPRPITYGGHTAGVAFRRIAERYVVNNPDLFSVPEQTIIAAGGRLESTTEAPDFIGRDISLAQQMAMERGVTLLASAAEGTVEWQYPPPDRVLFEDSEVFVEVAPNVGEAMTMADLRGLTVRHASAFLHRKGIGFVISGNGRVVKQSVRPGEELSNSTVCRLVCRPG